jgi:hypothetical protein
MVGGVLRSMGYFSEAVGLRGINPNLQPVVREIHLGALDAESAEILAEIGEIL